MKKLVAIALSILFCITLTCCGTEDVLAGLPEIPRDERIFYNGTRIENGEGLNEARPVTECPYDEEPTLDEAEKDGAFIQIINSLDSYNVERTVKNTSAMERFIGNVNRGIDDSLLTFYVTQYKDRTNTSAYFLYYTNGELKSVYNFGKKYTERLYVDDDEVKVMLYGFLPYSDIPRRGLFIAMEHGSIDASSTQYGHDYLPYSFIALTETAALYEEGVTEKFVNVAGVHEGDGGETKLYEKYPFEEAFPTAKEVFDLGGVVIFDNDFATKAYNTAAIKRFRQNMRNKIPDTLFVYTDKGDICTVMYSYTGESVIISTDSRADGRGDIFTNEIFGETMGFSWYGDPMDFATASKQKKFESWNITVRYKATDDKSGEATTYEISAMTKIPPIQYVTEHIVPESEAKNYK